MLFAACRNPKSGRLISRPLFGFILSVILKKAFYFVKVDRYKQVFKYMNFEYFCYFCISAVDRCCTPFLCP